MKSVSYKLEERLTHIFNEGDPVEVYVAKDSSKAGDFSWRKGTYTGKKQGHYRILLSDGKIVLLGAKLLMRPVTAGSCS